jgi:hypothetical protein
MSCREEEGTGYYAATNMVFAFHGLKDIASEEERDRYQRCLEQERHRYTLPSWKDQFDILTELSKNERVSPIE